MKFASIGLLVVAGCWAAIAQAQPSDVEDIYVLRSFRLSRNQPTSFCAPERTGFDKTTVEDRYHFKSVSTRTSDGLIMDANVEIVGALHACFGSTPEPQVFSFYAEGNLGTTPFIGKGECRVGRNDFPEPGIRTSRCFMTLEGLPGNYTGGLLTTSSINSRNVVGETSDPPGYVQPSIATVRLWKKRSPE